jgi:PilZ domain-containing protein
MSRPRRFPIQTPVRYRANDGPWRSGTTESISRTGVLLHVDEPLPRNTRIEMVVELPAVQGEQPAHVVCTGRIVRADAASDKRRAVLAATITRYKIDH